MGLRKLLEFNLAQRLYDKHSRIRNAIVDSFVKTPLSKESIEDYEFHMEREKKSFRWGSSVARNRSTLSFWITTTYNVLFIFFIFVLEENNNVSSACQMMLVFLLFYIAWKEYDYRKQKELLDNL